MNKKEITIADLAVMMQEGFANTEKGTGKKIEDLALTMQTGFANAEKKTDKKIEDLALTCLLYTSDAADE